MNRNQISQPINGITIKDLSLSMVPRGWTAITDHSLTMIYIETESIPVSCTEMTIKIARVWMRTLLLAQYYPVSINPSWPGKVLEVISLLVIFCKNTKRITIPTKRAYNMLHPNMRDIQIILKLHTCADTFCNRQKGMCTISQHTREVWFEFCSQCAHEKIFSPCLPTDTQWIFDQTIIAVRICNTVCFVVVWLVCIIWSYDVSNDKLFLKKFLRNWCYPANYFY